MTDVNTVHSVINVDPDNKPDYCDLILLENCMLRCKMCHMWRCEKEIDLVPALYYEKFIHALAKFFGSDMQILFVGGEPLLKPGIIDLIRSAAKERFFTSLTSNGYLIDRPMAAAIMNARISSLALSLDSLDAKKHDSLRGISGVFIRVQKALKYLSQYKHSGQSICIVCTIMAPNLDDIVALADWAEKHKEIACITFQVISEPFFTGDNDEWYRDERFSFLWPKDTQAVIDLIDRLIERKEKNYKIGNSVNQFAMFKRYFEHPERFVKYGGCHLGYNSLSVNSSGDIFLCFDQPPIGNIMRNDISDIWFSEHAHSVRARIKGCKQHCKSMINCFSEDGFSI
jgi:MoaA/NifB/PqqE/SkfB family radical SAM enzyme